MDEAKIMRGYDHPSIVELHGVAAQQHPLMIVMELCEGFKIHIIRGATNATRSICCIVCVAIVGLCHLDHVLGGAANCRFGACDQISKSVVPFPTRTAACTTVPCLYCTLYTLPR